MTIANYPGGCRGGWYKLGRNAEYFIRLQDRGIFRETRVGSARLTLVSASELADAMREILAENPAILLHRNNCRDCAKHKARIL